MRVHVYKTEAIVLERRDFGEADRLLTLYTPGKGKIRALAKGSRRTTSRLSGHVELFTHTSLMLAVGRNLDIVTQSQLIHSHERLREDIWRAALGFQVVELVSHFSQEHLENLGVWQALIEVLRRLDEPTERIGTPTPPAPLAAGGCAEAGHALGPERAEAGYSAASERSEMDAPDAGPGRVAAALRAELAVRLFEARLLELNGYRPELRCCTLCRERLEPGANYFHAFSGGLLCPSCAEGQAGLLPLSVEAVKLLRLLQDGEYSLACRLRGASWLTHDVETALRRHITHVLERDLRAPRLLEELRVLAPAGMAGQPRLAGVAGSARPAS